ncbi:hypothetical protein HDU93_001572, partial [Gonapodya sp. JEL0774]
MTKKGSKPSSAGGASSFSGSGSSSSKAVSSVRPGSAPLTAKEEREARFAAAQEAKRALFGSWTGKTPLSLLHEHCQKQGWGKAQLNTIRVNSGYVTNVTLSKEGQTVRIVPTEGYSYKTPDESKHYGATFALHRVASARNIGTLLPPDHKALWNELNQRKQLLEQQNGREWMDFHFAADPFAAALAREKKREDDRKEKERAVKERKEKARKLKASYPALHLSQELRKSVEELIKKTGISMAALEPVEETALYDLEVSDTSDSEEDDIVDLAQPESTRNDPKSGRSIQKPSLSEGRATPDLPTKRSATTSSSEPLTTSPSPLVSSISALGFHTSHVREAIAHVPKADQASVLDWLLLHVPEDDLPQQFMDKRYRTGLSASNLSKEELADEYRFQRLRSLGFSTTAVRSAMSQTTSELSALENLVRSLPSLATVPSGAPNPPEDFSEIQSFADRVEELMTLRAIYGDDRVWAGYDGQIAGPREEVASADPGEEDTSKFITSISIALPTALAKHPHVPVLSIYFPPVTSMYPRTPCVPVVTCEGVPASVRLFIMRSLYDKARDVAEQGQVAGFELAERVEAEMEGIVKDPPP